MARRLNINIGIMGHIDSGKTSLGASALRVLRACNDP